MDTIKALDLILFKETVQIAKIINEADKLEPKAITFTRVGLVINDKVLPSLQKDKLYVLDIICKFTNLMKDYHQIVQDNSRIAVIITPLEERIKDEKEKGCEVIAIGKLKNNPLNSMNEQVVQCIFKQFYNAIKSYHFDLTLTTIMSTLLCCIKSCNKAEERSKEDEWTYGIELIIQCYKAFGIYSKNMKKKFTPAEIAYDTNIIDKVEIIEQTSQVSKSPSIKSTTPDEDKDETEKPEETTTEAAETAETAEEKEEKAKEKKLESVMSTASRIAIDI